jgi:hypothetical protein
MVTILFILPKVQGRSELSFATHGQALLLVLLVSWGLLVVFQRAVVRLSRLEPVEPGRNLLPHGNS